MPGDPKTNYVYCCIASILKELGYIETSKYLNHIKSYSTINMDPIKRENMRQPRDSVSLNDEKYVLASHMYSL